MSVLVNTGNHVTDTDTDPDKIAGYLIDVLRERDDVRHVARYDYQNKEIEVIVELGDLEDKAVIIPSDTLRVLTDMGFETVSARFNESGNYSSEARVMRFERS